MKRLLIISLMLLTFGSAWAQDSNTGKSEQEVTIFDILAKNTMNSGTVIIEQSDALKNAVTHHVVSNGRRRVSGYRVRIFFDNSQNARAKSQSVASSFSSMYPKIAVYRTYDNPFFKVSVGDFRTRADAQMFADQIRGVFPSVFLVKETINAQ
ncbi:MAG: SPOR domain-containing protein [Bacteroidales bacterium]|nr:SPOR domain-containing protein [Bacteroidales bacterium]